MKLISCIMPTTEARSEFAKRAVEGFNSQTYDNRELIVVRGPGTIGEKRNRACWEAKGDIICHWDDDDFSAPGRIADQVKRLVESRCEVTGYEEMRFLDASSGQWYVYRRKGYALGTSLMYWRNFWMRRRFAAVNIGEDNVFQRGVRLALAPAGEMMYATIHPGNTSVKRVSLRREGAWRRLGALG